MDGSSLWGLLTVVGPILLAAVLLWALLHNRRTRAENDRTEAATHELYERTDREDKNPERRDV
ncbi:MAG: hypothetical protein JWM38_2162 [Sphingomonas bacterium]|jgi:hypothetical protein|nr:hypothetical protein [Sphingomonas bacterium]MDB5718735.1 hypothetical protein [Sphingomonas bacterium]